MTRVVPTNSCLYFPTIDIDVNKYNAGIFKRMLLCWEHIWTIVPNGFENPYRNSITKKLNSQGIIKPLYVNSYQNSVRLAGEAVSKVIGRDEMSQIISESDDGYSLLYDEKLPMSIKSALNWGKLPKDFVEISTGQKASSGPADSYFRVHESFAEAYMAVLAKYISDENNLALVTDSKRNHSLSELARFGRPADGIDLSGEDIFPEEADIQEGVAVLHDILMSDLSLDPSTPISKILKFREKYPDEVARYRTAITRAATEISDILVGEEPDIGRVTQWVKHNVEPSVRELEAALNGSQIATCIEQTLKIATYSVAPTALVTWVGAPASITLPTGLALTIIGAVQKIRNDRSRALAREPYAYLYLAQREFGRKSLVKNYTA